MDKIENDLYKIRSFGGCIKAAFDLFRTNVKTLCRRTWLAALVTAIIGALFSVVSLSFTFTASPSIAAGVAFIVLALAYYAATIWYDTIIVSLLNGRSMHDNGPRVTKAMLLLLLVWILVMIITIVLSTGYTISQMKSPNDIAAIGKSVMITMGIFIIVAIAILPLTYSVMKYFIEPDQKLLSIFKKPYRTGWRHWGYIFVVCLIAGIIVSIIYIVVSMPFNITMVSWNANNTGIMMGDENGLPGYFKILFFLAALIATFIMIYSLTWFMFVDYYCYGHIEAKEKAKKELKTTTQFESTHPQLDYDEDPDDTMTPQRS